MKFKTVSVGLYEVNCTLAIDGGDAWVVDPGADEAVIEKAAEAEGAKIAGVLLTHAHFDHIGAIPGLKARFPEMPVYVHPSDEVMFGHPFNQFPPDYPSFQKPAGVVDARKFPLAEVIETPGHTPGGVCYYFKDDGVLLSGDTLFAGSVGRTDFPGGSMSTLVESLKKLKALPDGTKVIPGHGPSTTIGEEKGSNPFL